MSSSVVKEHRIDSYYSGKRRKGKGISMARSMELDAQLNAMYELSEPRKAYTLHEIAEVIGCSKEAVRLMELKAIRRARLLLNAEMKEMK